MINLKKKLTANSTSYSLLGEILDWLLAPLLLVWPISIAFTYHFSADVAGYPYDQALQERVAALARHVQFVNGQPQINLHELNRQVAYSHSRDTLYFQVRNQKRLFAGEHALPLLDVLSPREAGDSKIYFRDAQYKEQDIRVAYTYISDGQISPEHWLLIQVGETLKERGQLANRIIASVVLPQFIIIPLAVLLVWFGLTRGLRSINRLRRKIEARPPHDLSPISIHRIPEEVKPLVEAFNALLDRMKHSVSIQQRFIADAAHQLRTPLTGLKTQAQLAIREAGTNQQKPLQQLSRGVNRATRLVNQLLSLVRTEVLGVQSRSMARVDLDLLSRKTLEDWVTLSLQRKIDIGFEGSKSAVVWGNATLLRELLNNLIDNALLYTPADGHGRVTCRIINRKSVSEIVLEIEDNGIGISPEHAERIFDRFYRVDENISEGSGLGLAIVREIAEQHEAIVSLISNNVAPDDASTPQKTSQGIIVRVQFRAYTA